MIGRKEEQKLLQSLIKEEEPQFVAVFGRRRIGKTYLIRESFDYEFSFQHTSRNRFEFNGTCHREVRSLLIHKNIFRFIVDKLVLCYNYHGVYRGLTELANLPGEEFCGTFSFSRLQTLYLAISRQTSRATITYLKLATTVN